MESLALLRQAILQVLTPASGARYPMAEVREMLVRDTSQNRFLVVRTGWHHGINYYALIQDVEIQNGAIVIHQNNTEHDLAEELLVAGVPAGRIVLNTVAPEQRQLLAS